MIVRYTMQEPAGLVNQDDVVLLDVDLLGIAMFLRVDDLVFVRCELNGHISVLLEGVLEITIENGVVAFPIEDVFDVVMPVLRRRVNDVVEVVEEDVMTELRQVLRADAVRQIPDHVDLVQAERIELDCRVQMLMLAVCTVAWQEAVVVEVFQHFFSVPVIATLTQVAT